MAGFKITRKQRLIATIAISASFFVAELVVGFYTKSLALVADAFHYMNDLIGFIVALTALIISERSSSPQALSFGWQRAQLLGAFFNGVFLLALGISIFLQSIERFIELKHVENPVLVLIMGCVGFGLNVLVMSFLHEHDHEHGHGHGHGHKHQHEQSHSHSHSGEHAHGHNHGHSHRHADNGETTVEISADGLDGQVLTPIEQHQEHRHTVAKLKSPGRDLGMLGVMIHVIGDAINNIGVIIAAVAIWQSKSDARFYADPAVSLFIAISILLSSIPLVKNAGHILLQSAPRGVELADVKHDLEKIPGIESVHELHVWRLDQKKSIASVHVVVSDKSVKDFMEKAKTISECLHAYGIHSATLQPELATPRPGPEESSDSSETVQDVVEAPVTTSAVERSSSSIRRRRGQPGCQIICGSLCENLMCCAAVKLA